MTRAIHDARLPAELKEQLAEYAAQNETTMGAVIRETVEKYGEGTLEDAFEQGGDVVKIKYRIDQERWQAAKQRADRTGTSVRAVVQRRVERIVQGLERVDE